MIEQTAVTVTENTPVSITLNVHDVDGDKLTFAVLHNLVPRCFDWRAAGGYLHPGTPLSVEWILFSVSTTAHLRRRQQVDQCTDWHCTNHRCRRQ
ncbi:MAG: hypothetical protein U0350_18690 [Caldilineaceae bacterium]